jgi:natural product precursor
MFANSFRRYICMSKLNKLTLHQETIRNLTSTELKKIVGGFGTATCNCSGQPQTCQFTVCLGTCPPPVVPVE